MTWQNKAGKWWAMGPLQTLWAGEESEDKALPYVYSKSRGKATYLGRHGKYLVYDVGYNLKSYDKDIRKKLPGLRY